MIFDKIENSMKRKRRILIMFVVVVVISFISYLFFCFAREKYHNIKKSINVIDDKVETLINRDLNYPRTFDYSWVDNNITYGHAFGQMENGDTYTNSLEAFITNYEAGQRVFEVDLSVTVDFVTVCFHDDDTWREFNKLSEDVEFTYENYMNIKTMNKYTPLDYKDLIDLLDEYKNIYVSVDGKYYDKENVYLEYYQLVSYAKKIDESILDRIIPEIYTEEMYEVIMNIYPFKSIEYDIYQVETQLKDIVSFCIDSGVSLVVFNKDELTDETINRLKAYDIKVGVFTVNDLSEAKELVNKGVDILCTDVLVNSDFS